MTMWETDARAADGTGDGPGGGGTGGVVIHSPGELAASVPALLGFVPGADSVVAMCARTDERWSGPVLRFDAPGLFGARQVSEDEEIPLDSGPAQYLADFCEREGFDEVHLVLVHPGCVEDVEAGRRARDAAEALEFWLGLAGVVVPAVVLVGRLGAGEPWFDLVSEEGGGLGDPGATELAARNAVDGRVCGGSREEIDALYAGRDPGACEDEQPAGAHRRTGHARARAVRLHHELATRFGAGDAVEDAELARLGAALRDVHVRDALLTEVAARPLGVDDGRRDLWWALARRRPPTERSAALTLLGAAHYFAGNGVHAWSALARAVEADPGNGLAPLLLDALGHGLPPALVRGVAGEGGPDLSGAPSGRGRRAGR